MVLPFLRLSVEGLREIGWFLFILLVLGFGLIIEVLDGRYRLFDVDNRCYLPFGVPSRIIVRRADVLHA